MNNSFLIVISILFLVLGNNLSLAKGKTKKVVKSVDLENTQGNNTVEKLKTENDDIKAINIPSKKKKTETKGNSKEMNFNLIEETSGNALEELAQIETVSFLGENEIQDNKSNEISKGDLLIATETVPGKPLKRNSSYVIKLLLCISLACLIVFLAFVWNYRNQLEKYKIPPFTPPKWCPNFLFPRKYKIESEVYKAIEIGDYHPPVFSHF